MSEPTKEAITIQNWHMVQMPNGRLIAVAPSIAHLVKTYGSSCKKYIKPVVILRPEEWDHVRTQATNDTLERAAIYFEKEQAALSGDCIAPSRIAADIRAMKVLPDNASGVGEGL